MNATSRSSNFSFFLAIVFISVGYHHKLVMCGLFGKVLGFEWICYSVVHGITTNHWFEHLVFVPLIWVAFNHINNVVFRSNSMNISDTQWQKRKWVGQFLMLLYIYGHGMHVTNTAEIFARDQGVANGILYEQIYWLDEHLSHVVQFIPYFILISWFIIHDKLDRNVGKNVAIISGVLHGVDRGYGITEGNNPTLGIVLLSLVWIAVIYRWWRHGKDFGRAYQDFFFRWGFGLIIANLIFVIIYQTLFGMDFQFSHFEGIEAWRIVALGLSTIFGMILLFMGLDRVFQKKK